MIALSPSFCQWPTLREVVEAGALYDLVIAAQDKPVPHPNGTLEYEVPIPAPKKIICVGANFPDRNAEYKDGKDTRTTGRCSSVFRGRSPTMTGR